jgi:hypothetical protein
VLGHEQVNVSDPDRCHRASPKALHRDYDWVCAALRFAASGSPAAGTQAWS